MSASFIRTACFARPGSLLGATMMSLSILFGANTPVRAMDDDERPDLTIEAVGLPIPQGQREVFLRVTNQSIWWADETTAHIATVSPTYDAPTDLFVENLDPGQSTILVYTLPTGCTGQVVRAEVAAAGNWAGVTEGNLANNVIQSEVCSAPKPKLYPTVPKPQGDYDDAAHRQVNSGASTGDYADTAHRR
jgi:hypothetical protein